MLIDYATGEATAKSHRCRVCQGKSALVVAWSATANSYELRCGLCGGDELERQKSITQMWREDPQSVPVTVADRLEEKYGGRPMATTALAKLDEKSMLQRMDQARWTKELAPQDRQALAGLAVMYGLDPVMGELIVYESKPYITTNGHLRKANEHPAWEGLTDRPMSPEERAAYAITAPVACIVEVYKRGMRAPAKGIGTADPANPLRGNPLERKEPYRQARSRAIRMALRTYFPHGLPFQSAEDAGIMVDVQTGEVLGPPPTDDDPGVIEGEIVEAAPVAESWPEDEGPDAGERPALDPLAARRGDFARYLEGKSPGSIGLFRQRFHDEYKVSLDEANLDTLDLAWARIHEPKAAKAVAP